MTGLLLANRATAICAVGSLLMSAPSMAGRPPRPNVLLILCDDMGFSDVGCYGGEIDTPNIDRVAQEGMRFTQFYNNAKCTTTRASLLTGLYPRNGGRGKRLLSDEMTTIAEALREAGYRCSLSGKWHLGSEPPHRPIDRGFDEFYGLMDGACNYFDPSRRDPEFKGGRIRCFGHNDEIITDFPEDYYITDAITDHAISTIRRFSESEEPWFAHVTYTAPHYPLHAKPADIEKYRGKYRAGWRALRQERRDRQREMGLLGATTPKPSPRDPEVYSWEEANQPWEDLRMATYAAMIDCMDENIGRILQTLDDLRVAEDTIVVFLSDNGGCAEEPGGMREEQTPGPREDYSAVGPAWAWAQNTPFRRYKTWMYEGGIATPMIVRYPRITPKGVTSDDVGHIIDLLPTFLELAGGEYPRLRLGKAVLAVEGESLLTTISGGSQARERPLYWCFNGNAAIRENDMKLVWDRGVRRWELYDLSVDRGETADVADSHPDVVARLSRQWESWAERTDARVSGLNR